MKKIEQIKNALSNIGGVQFVYLTYKTKPTFYKDSETSIYKLNIGANLENLYLSDLQTLNNLSLRKIKLNEKFASIADFDIKLARLELIKTIVESLSCGIGNNSNYKLNGYFEHVNKTIKIHSNDNNIETLYFNALCENKTILNAGKILKVKKSKPLTIAKNMLNYEYLKRSKIINMSLNETQIKSISINGNKIIIDAS